MVELISPRRICEVGEPVRSFEFRNTLRKLPTFTMSVSIELEREASIAEYRSDSNWMFRNLRLRTAKPGSPPHCVAGRVQLLEGNAKGIAPCPGSGIKMHSINCQTH